MFQHCLAQQLEQYSHLFDPLQFPRMSGNIWIYTWRVKLPHLCVYYFLITRHDIKKTKKTKRLVFRYTVHYLMFASSQHQVHGHMFRDVIAWLWGSLFITPNDACGHRQPSKRLQHFLSESLPSSCHEFIAVWINDARCHWPLCGNYFKKEE